MFQAIAKLGWLDPTLIQERAIPLILQNKDVLVRARTGSGKTGAFAIPTIQKIINLKQVRLNLKKVQSIKKFSSFILLFLLLLKCLKVRVIKQESFALPFPKPIWVSIVLMNFSSPLLSI